jgi:hypothetical protein
MTIVAEEGGKDSIPRRDVIEIVLDAGRMLYHGEGHVPMRRFGHKVKQSEMTDWERFYTEKLDPWIRKHYFTARFKRLMAQVFPHSRYE